MKPRTGAFVLVALACVAVAVGHALHVAKRLPSPAGEAAPDGPAPASVPSDREVLLYRSTALGDTFGRVMLLPLDAPPGAAQPVPLQCERLHYRAGRGVCLLSRRGLPTTYHARFFNDRFEVTGESVLAGAPSRARMSPDGRLAAFTVFVSGHGYAGSSFSTRTSIVDAIQGRVIEDNVETFELLRDGRRLQAADRNVWGVSFAPDSRRFVATVGTGGEMLLVEGDLAARRLTVIRDRVECPSWSPDGSRIAFKRREPGEGLGRFAWRLHVLELATGRETALASESRSVDDQVEWLDAGHILYALPDDGPQPGAATQLWRLAVDGSGAPRRFLPSAFSPSVSDRAGSR